ncbi:MAG TPA: glutathione synthase, partial [Burkholderiaceae bacterium]|nr:glutathione synthase [Burkholderiaceae bacterium]
MHVLFIIDPLPGLAAYKDTSVSMMQALVARGHRLSVAQQNQLYIDIDEVKVAARPIELVPGADLHGQEWWQWGGDATDQP